MNVKLRHLNSVLPSYASDSSDCFLELSDSLETTSSELAFEDDGEPPAIRLLTKRITHALQEAKEKLLDNKDLILPPNLLSRVVQDIITMSENEPCGLRGCVLFINLEAKTVCQRLAKIVCNPDTVATFEIFLTMKQDYSKWRNFKSSPISILKGFKHKPIVVIGEGYTLCKKKLYRSSSLASLSFDAV